MKKITALAVIGIASQTIVAFAGPEAKHVCCATTATWILQPNEFDIGAFATWARHIGFTFGPISDGHFNPTVTLADASQRGISWRDVPAYIGAQLLAGRFLAN